MKYARIVFGVVIVTMAYVLFLNPYSISVGGVTGLAVALNRSFHIPYTAMLIVFNTALFIAGIKVKGWAYTVRSFLAMLLVGILLDLPYPTLSTEFSKTTCMVIGSVLSGIGYGLVISADTSTGGSDQLALIIQKRLPRLSTGTIMTIFDGVVVFFDWTLGGSLLFSVVAVMLCNGAIDLTDMVVNRKSAPEWLSKSMNWYKRMSPQLRYAVCALAICVLTFYEVNIVIALRGTLIH